eukprot:g10973.t1
MEQVAPSPKKINPYRTGLRFDVCGKPRGHVRCKRTVRSTIRWILYTMFWKLHSLVAIVVLQVLAQTLTNGLPCKLADNCTWESVGCQVFGYELYCVNKNIAGVVERIDFLGISENITFLNFQYNHISGHIAT